MASSLTNNGRSSISRPQASSTDATNRRAEKTSLASGANARQARSERSSPALVTRSRCLVTFVRQLVCLGHPTRMYRPVPLSGWCNCNNVLRTSTQVRAHAVSRHGGCHEGRSPRYSMRFGPDRNGPKPARRSLTAARDFYQTGGYNRTEHLLRQPSWKGELHGDVELVRGERSAGLVTGQAGAGPQAPSSALPG